MRRTDFADLCGIGPSMVTKYADAGWISFIDEKNVDVPKSLAALEGRLDEEKRRAALVKYAELQKTAPQPTLGAPAAAYTPPQRSAKADLDDIRRDQAALELAQKAGLLMPVAEFERRAWNAVAAMRQAYETARRETAEQLCRDLGAEAAMVGVVSRRLQKMYVRAMEEFANELQVLEAEPIGETENRDILRAEAMA